MCPVASFWVAIYTYIIRYERVYHYRNKENGLLRKWVTVKKLLGQMQHGT